jgi:hypothetical protein
MEAAARANSTRIRLAMLLPADRIEGRPPYGGSLSGR